MRNAEVQPHESRRVLDGTNQPTVGAPSTQMRGSAHSLPVRWSKIPAGTIRRSNGVDGP